MIVEKPALWEVIVTLQHDGPVSDRILSYFSDTGIETETPR